MFERLSDEELKKDPIIEVIHNCTEEGQKVERNEGKTYLSVFRKLPCVDEGYVVE